ncbi:MAG: hypothetical protein JWQ61_4130 [Collimonas fungivorans]|uniref:hypothetical protein n=1 Tax=Collimonas fungivorans TaxID=158899 RepID=UPI0026F26A7D|nr:hypothetical protein [Collimonas fungivorans]MDB5769316.1 hypothetical protein [Collimonas fungivorans]
MRDDMFKVIVERPRRVHSNAYKGDGRPFRNQEDRPGLLGMKKGYNDRKGLNENLAPLKRFLEKQINRPWDKVYSEIRAAIDARSTVKQHILQHLDNFVAIQTRWEGNGVDGRVVLRQNSWSGHYVGLAESHAEMFVHPLTGILLRNRFYTNFYTARNRQKLALEQEKCKIRRIVSDRVQLHLLNQIWYEVTLDNLPPVRIVLQEADGVATKKSVCDKRWDVIRKAWVMLENDARMAPAGSSQDYYGCASLYAVRKRQLSSREMQKYQLNTPQKDPKGSFFLLRLFASTAFGRISG